MRFFQIGPGSTRTTPTRSQSCTASNWTRRPRSRFWEGRPASWVTRRGNDILTPKKFSVSIERIHKSLHHFRWTRNQSIGSCSRARPPWPSDFGRTRVKSGTGRSGGCSGSASGTSEGGWTQMCYRFGLPISNSLCRQITRLWNLLSARVVPVQRRAVLRARAGQPDPVQVQQLVVLHQRRQDRTAARGGVQGGEEAQTAPLQCSSW